MKKLFALSFLAFMSVGSFAETPLMGWAGLIGLAALLVFSRQNSLEHARLKAVSLKVTVTPVVRKVPAPNLFSY
jgi:hypothetical protein